MSDQRHLVECQNCRLLYRSESYSGMFCAHCTARMIEWAKAQERLDRQHARHHT